MPNNPDRPFAHDTLKLRAVFVPDGAKGRVSKADITGPLGYGAVKVPAVFVPEGGKRPGCPYQPLGRTVFRPDNDFGKKRSFTTFPSSQSPHATEADSKPIESLPRTRYRFGADLARGRLPGAPPKPSSAGGGGNALAAGIAAWRGMPKPGNPLHRRLATPGLAVDKPRGAVTAAATEAANVLSGRVEGLGDAAAPVGQPPNGPESDAPDSDAAKRDIQA